MKLYLECLEILPLGSTFEAEFIRADITDKSVTDVVGIKLLLTNIMVGVPFRMTRHYCYHDENKVCIMELEI